MRSRKQIKQGKLYVWEEEAEKAIKKLVRMASKAVKENGGANIFGACANCGQTRPGIHEKDCVILGLTDAIKQVRRIVVWR